MKAIRWMVALAAVQAALSAPAWAATTDPEVIIYRFPGVRDDLATEIATAFHCTNFSGVPETIRFVTRFLSGAAIASNVTVTIAHLATTTVTTHPIAAYVAQTNLATSTVQGTTAIAATSNNII